MDAMRALSVGAYMAQAAERSGRRFSIREAVQMAASVADALNAACDRDIEVARRKQAVVAHLQNLFDTSRAIRPIG